MVKTRRFRDAVYLGDPINAVKLFNDLACDELIVVDICATREGREPDLNFISEFAAEAFMPLTYGGGVSKLAQIKNLFSIGIEKVVINSAAATTSLVQEASQVFGSQSIVGAIDIRKSLFGRTEAWIRSARENTNMSPVDRAIMLQEAGVGELFVQFVDLEGARTGFDLHAIQAICDATQVPVVACGGAGSLSHIRELFAKTTTSAAAAGTMFTLHGKHRAPLISYPMESEIQALRQPAPGPECHDK
jgi:cyclase